jgi:hypothetical protein
MSNLVTLTQDEINRFSLKGKEVGDAITAEEYSKHQKEYLASQDKKEVKTSDSVAPKSDKK